MFTLHSRAACLLVPVETAALAWMRVVAAGTGYE